MGERVKVHMIGNAHLDPVWLWSWQSGLDEALATASSAVKLLKEYRELVFTRSDVWFHQVVEILNPDLFTQIKELVAQGRWQIVGGWYIQPDCNLPTEYGFAKHFEIGKKYFKDKFDVAATVGYNVDSFGHAGTLPRILHEAGFRSYVYMRPGPHEKSYPSANPVFWWEASDSDHRVLAYRIVNAYCAGADHLDGHIRQTLAAADPGLGHVMCFYGIGDHGGGPTRKQIEWIKKNKDRFDGFELVFSHPQAYFDAIKDKTADLPVVKGELQHHAVGCYSVLHRFKQEVRQAEHELAQTQALVNAFGGEADPNAAGQLEKAWQDVLFGQFHDTLGGTCIQSAYEAIRNQIGRACATGDELRTNLLRRLSRKLPKLEVGEKNGLTYFAAMNSHSQEYVGWVERELFNVGDREFKLCQVNGETKKEIAYQKIRPECTVPGMVRILTGVKLSPASCPLFLVKSVPPSAVETDLRVNHEQIFGTHWQVKARPTGLLATTSTNVPFNITWQVFEDLSDTWSHGKTRLGDRHLGALTQEKLLIEESGPLRAALTWLGDFVHSRIRVRAHIYRQEKWLELRISLFWNHPRSMVKMVIEPREPFTEEVCGAPAGTQGRQLDGKEYPFHDWIILSGKQNKLAVLSPDFYGYDAQKESVRFTLVRSPIWAHHEPAKIDEPWFRYDMIDQGQHEYRILIAANGAFEPASLRKIATQLQQPPLLWDPPYREGYPRE